MSSRVDRVKKMIKNVNVSVDWLNKRVEELVEEAQNDSTTTTDEPTETRRISDTELADIANQLQGLAQRLRNV